MDNRPTNLSNSDLKLLILRSFAKWGQRAKYNFLGKAHAQGDFERELNTTFSMEERNYARRALEELMQGDFIRPTMSDSFAPDAWLEITDKGRLALDRNALDELDEALREIDPQLVEIRRGAWSALASRHADSLRQAAHSGRELIDQTLKTGAPTDEIKSLPDFVPDKSSRDGVTRRMRIRCLMNKRRGHISDTDVDVAEKAGDLVVAIDNKLTASSHARAAPLAREVEDALIGAEIALRNVLTDSRGI